MSTATAAAAGLVVDQLAGESPRWHPVVGFGRAVRAFESRWYADRRSRGVVLAVVGTGTAAATGLALQRLLGRPTATVLATAVCAAGRMLDDEARAVRTHLIDGDLSAARSRVRSLVGRDASVLDEHELARAVVESLAENSVDAVTSSWWWAAVGGAPLVLAHRASNTLDAMVGHLDERYSEFGWASARLDDLANWMPARLTALSVAVARPARAGDVWRTVRRDAGRHPSPNGGVIEAAYAAALGVRLGGVNVYAGEVEDRGTLGDGARPDARTIDAAIELRRHSVAVLAVAGVAISRVVAVRRRARCAR